MKKLENYQQQLENIIKKDCITGLETRRIRKRKKIISLTEKSEELENNQ